MYFIPQERQGYFGWRYPEHLLGVGSEVSGGSGRLGMHRQCGIRADSATS